MVTTTINGQVGLLAIALLEEYYIYWSLVV